MCILCMLVFYSSGLLSVKDSSELQCCMLYESVKLVLVVYV